MHLRSPWSRLSAGYKVKMNCCTWRTCIHSRVKEDEEELWPERSSGLNNGIWRFSFFATDQFLERTFMISGNTPRVVSQVDGIVQGNRRTGREEDPFYCLLSPLKGISRKRKNARVKWVLLKILYRTKAYSDVEFENKCWGRKNLRIQAKVI